MRILILIFAALAILAILYRYRDEDGPAERDSRQALPDLDREQRERKSLEQVLSDAAGFFGAAREQAAEGQDELANALANLTARCEALAQRAGADDGFSRTLRQPILRLLLPLNGVARRAALASHRTPTVDRDALLQSSADAIRRAAEQLGKLTEKADEVALRRLEIDLEVLEGRLTEAE